MILPIPDLAAYNIAILTYSALNRYNESSGWDEAVWPAALPYHLHVDVAPAVIDDLLVCPHPVFPVYFMTNILQ